MLVRSHRARGWPSRVVVVVAMLAIVAAACTAKHHGKGPASDTPSFSGSPSGGIPAGIHKIQHVIVIMQENRSFDSYFGTYPGADGLPFSNGLFTVCSPNGATGACDPPYHDPHD